MAIGTPTSHSLTNITGSSGTTVTKQPTGTIPVGDHVIIVVGCGSISTTISSAADTQSNTYQVDRTENGTARMVAIISAKVTTQLTTSDTITVTYNASVGQRILELFSVNGLASASWLDQGNSGSGSGTTPSSGNITTTQAAELLIGCGRNLAAGSTFTPGGSFTALNNPQNGTGQFEFSAYRIVAATSTYAFSGTITSAGWGAAVASYKGAAAPAGGNKMAMVV